MCVCVCVCACVWCVRCDITGHVPLHYNLIGQIWLYKHTHTRTNSHKHTQMRYDLNATLATRLHCISFFPEGTENHCISSFPERTANRESHYTHIAKSAALHSEVCIIQNSSART